MLALDGVIYFLLTIYFDNVIQGEYGRAKPFYYFIMPSYWFSQKKGLYEDILGDENTMELRADSDCEEISDDFKNKVALRITRLVKTYTNEEKQAYNAVDNLNLTVYSGQITAIVYF